MKLLIYSIIISAITITTLLSLPSIIGKKDVIHLSDTQLRKMALSLNLKSIPKTYDELLKVVDNPQNRMTPLKIRLGEKLFFDTTLSRDKDINCASCHDLNDGGDDNLPMAIGHRGLANPFHLNSPTVLNSALAVREFWNGSAKDVEEQAGGPIQAPFEMNMTPKEVEERLNNIVDYKNDFKRVFGSSIITFENVRKAIGAYERTLLTRGKFDEFLDGDNDSINEKAKKGLTLFITKGCKGCHTGMSVGGQSMQKFPLRTVSGIDKLKLNIELNPDLKILDTTFPFENRGGFLGADNRKIFRVPILRNITKTSPYFHNGMVKEIDEAVRIMGRHQIGVEFTDSEVDEIVEFLKTLEGDIVDYSKTFPD